MGDVLRHRATELGVADRALIPGAMSNIADVYQAADVVALPSWEEPMGLATLEAMASGAAVVASNAGGVPEAIDDGQTGLLVPPRSPVQLAQAIKRILGDPALSKRLGQAAQQRVRNMFTIERYARQLQDALIAAAR
jgi:glycosyltransferase involved in cell wall biosynthesis